MIYELEKLYKLSRFGSSIHQYYPSSVQAILEDEQKVPNELSSDYCPSDCCSRYSCHVSRTILVYFYEAVISQTNIIHSIE